MLEDTNTATTGLLHVPPFGAEFSISRRRCDGIIPGDQCCLPDGRDLGFANR